MLKSLPAAAIALLLASPSFAQSAPDTPSMFNVNTLFVIVSAILVMWMAAGFAMVEAGFVRAQGVITQCAKNIGLFAIASVGFLLCGYGLLYPESWIVPGMLGQPAQVDIGGVADSSNGFDKRGHASAAIVFFQMMFAATVVSIVSGALAERMKLVPFFIFAAALGAIIYPIQASWSWGGGFLTTQFGFVDLAGSTVVHVVGGVSALTGSIILGARAGRYKNGVKVPMTSFNLPIATLGTLILWMGWFGFNAGSYLNFNTEADAANVSRILLN
ncbi:MAG: ammonium transporter, partial [Pseudomonadota bacterium]